MREHRVAGRNRVVVEPLRAGHELVAARRGEEEAAVGGIVEQVDGEQREAMRLGQEPRLAGREVELEQAVCHVRVVVEEALAADLSLPPGAREPPVLARQRPEQELRHPSCRVEPVAALEPAGALGERREGEPVPGREHLVVEARLGPQLTLGEQPGPQLRVERAADDRAAVLERLQELRRHAFLLGPREREPLDAVRVGVLRRGEAAVGQPQLANHVVERLLDDRAIPRLPRDDERVQVRGDEQGVVVEHLLEVRHEPPLVDRVAVEATADEVVHPAGSHPVERLRHHRHRLRRPAAEEELEVRGGRELGCPSEAAVGGLERARDPALRLVEQGRR